MKVDAIITVPATTTSQKSGSFVSFDEVAALWFGRAAVSFTAAAALAGMFAWMFSNRVNSTKDAALDQFQEESRTSIAAAETRAAEANERAALASNAAAEATERTGRVEIEAERQRERAAKAERQLLELQQRIADRRLTEEQRTVMLPILREVKRKRPLSVEWAASPEISRFGQDITELLKSAGWPFNATAVLSPTAGAGLIISSSTLDFDVAKLQEAFKAVGYTSAIALTPGFDDHLRLTIGSKP